MTENPFDQFDAAPNPFDQFDGPEAFPGTAEDPGIAAALGVPLPVGRPIRQDVPMPPVDESSLGGDWEAGMLQAGMAMQGLDAMLPLALMGVPDAAIGRQTEGAANLEDMLAERARVLGGAPDPGGLVPQPQRLREGAAEIDAMSSDGSMDPMMRHIVNAAGEIARREAAVSEIPVNPSFDRFMQSGEGDTFMEQALDALGAAGSGLVEDPYGMLRTATVRSLPSSAPGIAAGVAGSALAGPVGAAIGSAAGEFGTEAAMTTAQGISERIREAGVDPADPEAVEALIAAQPDVFAGLLPRAFTRGAIIGAGGAVSGGVSGVAARNLARGGRGGKAVGDVAAGLAIEPATEAVTEGVAQLATDGTINPADALAEALGGLGQGAVSLAGQTGVEAVKAALAPQPQNAPPGAADGPPAPPAPLVPPAAASAPAAPQQPPVQAPEAVEARPAPAPEAVPAPARGLEAIPAASIVADPVAFQFKAGGDAAGVTGTLDGTKRWDPAYGGVAIVYEDEQGQRFIVDGHQRLGLAKRLEAAGHPPIEMNAIVLRASEGVTKEEARLFGALKNMAEGGESTSPIDVAKVLRGGVDVDEVAQTIPPKRTAFRDGQALAKLGDEAFGMVVNEVVPAATAAEVANVIADPDQQVAALKFMAQRPPANRAQARMVAQQIVAAGFDQGETDSLFGPEAFAESLMVERADVLDRAVKMLKGRRRALANALANQNVLSGAGNVISEDGTREAATDAERAALVVEKLATRAGPVSDALGRAARALKDGAKPGDAVKAFLDEVEGMGEADLRDPEAAGADARQRTGTTEGGRIDLTPEGEQTVIPGAEQITDVERATRGQGAPMRGGNAPPPENGLFGDSQNQPGLFGEPSNTQGGAEAPIKVDKAPFGASPKYLETAARTTAPRPDTPYVKRSKLTAADVIALERRLRVDFGGDRKALHNALMAEMNKSTNSLLRLIGDNDAIVRRTIEQFNPAMGGLSFDGPIPGWAKDFLSDIYGRTAKSGAALTVTTSNHLIQNPDLAAALGVSLDFVRGGGFAAALMGNPVGENMVFSIVFTDKSLAKRLKALETMAHEFGHFIQYDTFNSLSIEERAPILAEWVNSRHVMDATLASITRQRPLRMQRGDLKAIGAGDVNDIPSKNYTPSLYNLSFAEFFADQVSRALTTSQPGLSAVDKFFARVARAWRQVAAALRRAGYVGKSVEEWLSTLDPTLRAFPVPASNGEPDDARADRDAGDAEGSAAERGDAGGRDAPDRGADAGDAGDDVRGTRRRQDRAEDAGEAADGLTRRPKGKFSPRFSAVSRTAAPSIHRDALAEVGLTQDTFEALPMAERVKALAAALKSRFGFEVEIPKRTITRKNLAGRKVQEERTRIAGQEAVDQLFDAFHQLTVLAHVMKMPVGAMSLPIRGKPITLSLVSQNEMGALGMFSWGGGGRTITLPGRSNSFAHEWAHALDHYLAQTFPNPQGMLSRQMDDPGVTPPLSPVRRTSDAFAKLMQAMFSQGLTPGARGGRAGRAGRAALGALMLRLQIDGAQLGKDGKPTPAAQAARKILADMREGKRPPAKYLGSYFASSKEFDDAVEAGGYFTDPAEMFARAFEAWIGRVVGNLTDDPQAFLTKGEWAYLSTADERLAKTFPKGANFDAIAVALADLTVAMAETEMFGSAAPPALTDDPGSVDVIPLTKLFPQGSRWSQQKAEIRKAVAAFNRSTKKAAARGFWNSTADIGTWLHRTAFASISGALHAVANSYTGTAKAAVQNIADMIGTDPGSGRPILSLFQDEVTTIANARMNLLKNMVEGAKARLGNRDLTEAENTMLHALLTGQGVPGLNAADQARLAELSGKTERLSPAERKELDAIVGRSTASPALKTLAREMRFLLDTIWYDLHQAGITLGYASGYLPRLYSTDKIQENYQGFMDAASEVYSLMFDREVRDNADPDTRHQDAVALMRSLRAYMKPLKDGEAVSAPRVSDADEAIWQTYLKARKAAKNSDDQKKADALETAEAAMLDMLERRYSDAAAQDWHLRLTVGRSSDFDRAGPQGSFLKGRKLPPEADSIMRPFMDNDPVALVTGYAWAAARRAEYAKRFGPNGEKLENMLDAFGLAAAGSGRDVARDVDYIRSAVNAATGRVNAGLRGLQDVNNLVFMWGTLKLLGRAALSSIAEPITLGLRTGNAWDGVRAAGAQIGMAFSKASRDEARELAMAIGMVTNSLNESITHSRFGADGLNLREWQSQTLALFFEKSWLTGLTNSQRMASMKVAHMVLMRHLGRTVLGKKRMLPELSKGSGERFSDGELNELGIVAADRADLLEWLDSLGGMPTVEDLFQKDGTMHPAGQIWARAVNRIVGEGIQSPRKTDRPLAAANPLTAGLYGIMGFIYAFHRNIISRTIRRGQDAKATRTGKVGVAAKNLALAAPAMGMLMMGQMLTTIPREFFLNRDTWDEEEEKAGGFPWGWLLNRAFSRTGFTGAYDPLYQAVVGIRYQRDLTAILAGTYASSMLAEVATVISTFSGRNSENNNKAEHNAAAAAYRAVAQPALMYAIAHLMPGGYLLGPFAAAGIMAGSGPQVSREAASLMVGEKDK